jgi:hypothetical protein
MLLGATPVSYFLISYNRKGYRLNGKINKVDAGKCDVAATLALLVSEMAYITGLPNICNLRLFVRLLFLITL